MSDGAPMSAFVCCCEYVMYCPETLANFCLCVWSQRSREQRPTTQTHPRQGVGAGGALRRAGSKGCPGVKRMTLAQLPPKAWMTQRVPRM